VELWGVTLKKIEKKTVVLREGINADIINAKIGKDAFKYEINMDYLKSCPLAHDLLEIKRTYELRTGKAKTIEEDRQDITQIVEPR